MSDTVEGRFDAKWTPEPNTGCWLWTAHVNWRGYGDFSVDGKLQKAHRYAYERWVGPIPDGLQIDHLCCVKSCVNPAHLEAVTPRENTRRAVNGNAAKTHCKNGHPYNDENTYLYSRGGRACKACHRTWDKAWKRQHRAPTKAVA